MKIEDNDFFYIGCFFREKNNKERFLLLFKINNFFPCDVQTVSSGSELTVFCFLSCSIFFVVNMDGAWQ